MLTIRREQMTAFRDVRLKQFESLKLDNISSRFPSWYAKTGKEGALGLIRTGVDKARQYHITDTTDISSFIDLMIRYGQDFETVESIAWETEALRDPEVPDSDRIDLLFERLGVEPEFREEES